MIIWGSKGKTKTIGQGYFFCPSCHTKRSYERKQIGKYFTLYFIPLFQTSNLGEYVECQFCHTTFKPEILDVSEQLEEAMQIERKRKELVKDIIQQLDAGLSLQFVAAAIKQAGASEEISSEILYAATDGHVKKCGNCGSVYKSTVLFCSICGTSLSRI